MMVPMVTALIGVLVIVVSVMLSRRIDDHAPRGAYPTPLDHALADIHQTAQHAWAAWTPESEVYDDGDV